MTSKIEIFESDLSSIKEDAKVFFHVLIRMIKYAEHINDKGFELTEAMLGIEEWESVGVDPSKHSVADKTFFLPDGSVRNRFKIDMYCQLLGYKSHCDLICEAKSSEGKYRPPIHSDEDFIRMVTFIQSRLLDKHYPKVFFEEFFKELRACWPTPAFHQSSLLTAESVKVCRSRNAGGVIRLNFCISETKVMLTYYSSLDAPNLIVAAESALSGREASLLKGSGEDVCIVSSFMNVRFCSGTDGLFLAEMHRNNECSVLISITEKHLRELLASLKKMVSNQNWNTSEDVLDVVNPIKILCKKSDGAMVELGNLRELRQKTAACCNRS